MAIYLFEFMDQPWLPQSLHATILEILHTCNSPPFQRYYEWVAEKALAEATSRGLENVVEVGAGTAPITQMLVQHEEAKNIRFLICDLIPNKPVFERLEKAHGGKVTAIYDPVDVTQLRAWPPRTLLVLSAMFHHIPRQLRPAALESLTKSGDRVLVCESIRRTPGSVLLVLLAIFPAMALPLLMIGKPGRLRRLLWCWLLPAAPLMYVWDAVISCLRQWTMSEWKKELEQALPSDRKPPKVDEKSKRPFYMFAW